MLIYLFLYIICFFILSRINRLHSFNLLIHTPMIFIVFLYETLGDSFDFYAIDTNVYTIIEIYLCVGLFTEIFVVYFFKNYVSDEVPNICSTYSVPLLFCRFIVFLCFIVLFFSYRYANELGIGSDDFQSKLASGWLGHLLVFLMAIPPFLYFSYLTGNVKKYEFYFAILMIFLCLFLKQVKSWVMIPLIYYFLMIVFYNKNIKITAALFRLLLIIIALSTLFFLVYIMQFMFSEDSGDFFVFWGQLTEHFLFYLFSGIAGFSEYLKHTSNAGNGNWYILISPIVNTINLFLSEPFVVPVNTDSYMISDRILGFSNVFTLFGTIWMYMGFLSIPFYAFIVSLMTFLSLNKSNIVFINIYLMLTSFGLFSWFEYYFFHLAAYELPIYIYIITNLFGMKNNEERYINHNS